MMDASARVLRGHFSLAGWAVSAAWVALAVAAAWRMAEPWNWVVAAFSVAASGATAVVARGLAVRGRDTGVSGAGLPEVAWEDVEHVGVRGRAVSVPYLSVRRGRALDDVALDGIACVGQAPALRLAQQVADAGDLGEVVVAGAERPSGPGRRGIRE